MTPGHIFLFSGGLSLMLLFTVHGKYSQWIGERVVRTFCGLRPG